MLCRESKQTTSRLENTRDVSSFGKLWGISRSQTRPRKYPHTFIERKSCKWSYIWQSVWNNSKIRTVFNCNVCDTEDFDLFQSCYDEGLHCDRYDHLLVEMNLRENIFALEPFNFSGELRKVEDYRGLKLLTFALQSDTIRGLMLVYIARLAIAFEISKSRLYMFIAIKRQRFLLRKPTTLLYLASQDFFTLFSHCSAHPVISARS